MTLTLVQGNNAPDIEGTIKKEDTPLDLTDCSVRFQMRKQDDRRFTVNAPASITDASAGEVRYSWAANDLAVPGDYLVQWQVTYPDERVQTTHPPNPITIRRE